MGVRDEVDGPSDGARGPGDRRSAARPGGGGRATRGAGAVSGGELPGGSAAAERGVQLPEPDGRAELSDLGQEPSGTRGFEEGAAGAGRSDRRGPARCAGNRPAVREAPGGAAGRTRGRRRPRGRARGSESACVRRRVVAGPGCARSRSPAETGTPSAAEAGGTPRPSGRTARGLAARGAWSVDVTAQRRRRAAVGTVATARSCAVRRSDARTKYWRCCSRIKTWCLPPSIPISARPWT